MSPSSVSSADSFPPRGSLFLTISFVFVTLRFRKIGFVSNSLPCAFTPKNGKRFRGPRSGGGFCEAKDGGIVGYGVTVAVIII